MLKFLEDYESAFMNIEYVIQRQYPQNRHEGGALHTDHGNWHLFIQNFMVPDLTDHLIENVEVSTDTWPAMVDELCCCLAKCQHHAVDIAKCKAHQATTDHEQSPPSSLMIEPNYSSVYASLQQPSFIQALSTDWRVGYELWKHIPKEFQEKLTTI